MKKEYRKPRVQVENIGTEAICTACVASLTNHSDLNECGYAIEMPVIGTTFLFPQDLGGCTCWQTGGGLITDMYCYMPAESNLFSS